MTAGRLLLYAAASDSTSMDGRGSTTWSYSTQKEDDIHDTIHNKIMQLTTISQREGE